MKVLKRGDGVPVNDATTVECEGCKSSVEIDSGEATYQDDADDPRRNHFSVKCPVCDRPIKFGVR